MKQITKLMIVGFLTTFLIIIIISLGLWSFSQSLAEPLATEQSEQTQTNVLPPPVQVDPNLPDLSTQLAELEQTAQDRRLTYEEQIASLQALAQEREAAYQTELNTAQNQLMTYQSTIAQRQQELATLNAQVVQLEEALAQRQSSYPVQLQQTQNQITAKQQELQTQLQTAQATLNEANQQLGR